MKIMTDYGKYETYMKQVTMLTQNIWHRSLQRESCFQKVHSKKHICFSIKIFKLCDSNGYTYDIMAYLGKDRQHATQDVTATHATVMDLMRRVAGQDHKLYMDNFIK
jgi:hypothetical protein